MHGAPHRTAQMRMEMTRPAINTHRLGVYTAAQQDIAAQIPAERPRVSNSYRTAVYHTAKADMMVCDDGKLTFSLLLASLVGVGLCLLRGVLCSSSHGNLFEHVPVHPS
jgi:hypothetical protein